MVGISTKTLMRELNVAKDWLDGDLKDRRADAVPLDKVLGDMLEAPVWNSPGPTLTFAEPMSFFSRKRRVNQLGEGRRTPCR